MIHSECNMWSTAHRQKKILNLMFILGLNETIDLLAMANSVCWYGYVLKIEEGHFLKRALDFEVEGQRKKERLKRTWNSRLRKKV